MIYETTLPYGASWGADDTIIFSRGENGIWRVPAAGGAAQAIIKPDGTKGELKLLSPQILAAEGAILFTVTHTPLPKWDDDTEVVVQRLTTGVRKVLVYGGADARYLPSGHLLYLRKGTLMAVAFDHRSLELTGGAGSLLYAPGGIFPDPERSLVWVDRNGSAEPLSLPLRPYASPRVSPDGGRFLVWTQGEAMSGCTISHAA